MADLTDNELYEKTSPVSKTAVATLFQLAAAGYEKSAEIAKGLGFQTKEYAWSLGDKDELEKVCMVTNRESRYVALNNAALESGCDIIYDLPCGFVHRAFEMADQGKTYVGGDLPEVIRSLKPVIGRMLSSDQKRKVRFSEVDVTNYLSVNDALKGLEGPVCICTEGLFVYLNTSDKQTVIQNIHRLLKERGGCWITVDPETLARHMAVFTAIAGDRASDILNEEMRGFSKESEVDVTGKSIPFLKKHGSGPEKASNSESEQEFLQNGFLVEKIPFTEGNLTLRSFSFLQPEIIEKLMKNLADVHIWKFTVNPDFAGKEEDKAEESPNIKAVLSESTLHFTLSGRIDSLSAPLLLKLWEKKRASEEFHQVEIDCKDLQYVSSAGLRVLEMIKKELGKGSMALMNVSDEVREILSVTGFEDSFQIRH